MSSVQGRDRGAIPQTERGGPIEWSRHSNRRESGGRRRGGGRRDDGRGSGNGAGKRRRSKRVKGGRRSGDGVECDRGERQRVFCATSTPTSDAKNAENSGEIGNVNPRLQRDNSPASISDSPALINIPNSTSSAKLVDEFYDGADELQVHKGDRDNEQED